MKSLKEEVKGLSIWGTIFKLGEWGTAFLVFYSVILPRIEDSQDARIELFHAEDNLKVQFRSLIEDETGWKKDRIHIKINDDHLEQKLIKKDLYKGGIISWVKLEMEEIRPHLIIIDGSEYWRISRKVRFAVHRLPEDNYRGKYFANKKWNWIYY